MNFLIYSDLHLQHAPGPLPHGLCGRVNACLIAGDLEAARGEEMTWLTALYEAIEAPVYLVLGNHDYWGDTTSNTHLKWRRLEDETEWLTYLENDAVELDSVRLLGCTLWTDYRLHGTPRESMTYALSGVWDHEEIRESQLHDFEIPYGADEDEVAAAVTARGNYPVTYLPRHAAARHAQSRAWLDEKLAEPYDGKTVVMTHHAPHPDSAPRRASYEGRIYPAYTSDLRELIRKGQPDLWVHGHIHEGRDYWFPELEPAATRIVCNPRGRASTSNSTPWFKEVLIVEV